MFEGSTKSLCNALNSLKVRSCVGGWFLYPLRYPITCWLARLFFNFDTLYEVNSVTSRGFTCHLFGLPSDRNSSAEDVPFWSGERSVPARLVGTLPHCNSTRQHRLPAINRTTSGLFHLGTQPRFMMNSHLASLTVPIGTFRRGHRCELTFIK